MSCPAAAGGLKPLWARLPSSGLGVLGFGAGLGNDLPKNESSDGPLALLATQGIVLPISVVNVKLLVDS